MDGYHRKAATRHLNAELNRLAASQPRRVGKRGRRSRYQGDPGFEAVPKAVWAETDYLGATNLVKARHEWLLAHENDYGTLRADIREQVLTVSSSTIDQMLKLYKYRGRSRCGTKPGALLREQIPISTAVWDVTKPGFLEGDTVANEPAPLVYNCSLRGPTCPPAELCRIDALIPAESERVLDARNPGCDSCTNYP